MRFDIITIFPEVFENYFNTSILKRAQEKKFIKIKIHNLRHWTRDKHKQVDDRPYGGGPGMVIRADIIYKAIVALTKLKVSVSLPGQGGESRLRSGKNEKLKIILLTPAGKQFDQEIAQRYSKLDRLILICGRYEGVDARVAKFVDEEISVGPYVLTGGELPAMLIVDAVTRLIPGVIKAESLEEETFGFAQSANKIKDFERIGEYPQYTRPEVFTYKDESGRIKKLRVPKVLLSGDHKKIKDWREKKSKFAI